MARCCKGFGALLAVVLTVLAPLGLRGDAASAPRPRETKAAAPSAAVELTDSYHDGTPDFLRLSSESDRDSFRRWFAFLAEAQYFRTEPLAEVNDCAALLRFAYREALRRHDGRWAAGLALPVPPEIPNIAQYSYPQTRLAAALFRVRAGQFVPADLRNGSFAEFADANALRRFNTYFVSRDLRAARRGDLLFFRQLDQRSPYHAMVYLGASQLEQKPSTRAPTNVRSFAEMGENYVIYHTGPIGKQPGEIRRPSIAELMTHPETRWRPVRDNPSFLGVYRWMILRGAD